MNSTDSPDLINDWPMLAANPQRTSWTPVEVRGNLNVAWYHPIEPYIPYKIQPIAANGKIYVSTARGLYTFRAGDGAHCGLSDSTTCGHSPTIATVNGKSVAFVRGYDRKFTPSMQFRRESPDTPFNAGAGFETNPS
jgi:hypothetical protein